MSLEFNCACLRNNWSVRQITKTGGKVECKDCNTALTFTIDCIEYSV